MEPLQEPICVRTARLNAQISGKSNRINRETLLDALTVLHDECSSDYLIRTDKNIGNFVEKFRTTLNETKRMRPNLTDFMVGTVIGRGRFGEVRAVQERQTGDAYALKSVRKADCLQRDCANFILERDVMSRGRSQWLTRLRYAFQDANCLYFVMEYHPGGDLLGLLSRQGGTIAESASVFYISEMITAINDLHAMGYVHRDIKPENILLDRLGHVKLADFGSAARLNAKGLVNEGLPVGTPEYIAPEVLQSINNKTNQKITYGISCDYWSVGIIAYQLIVGQVPFTGSSTAAIYTKIMNHAANLKLPTEISLSQGYVSVLKGLITDQYARLTYEKILKHQLFANIDFNGLSEQIPPFVPTLSSQYDTSNFTDLEPKKNEPHIDNFRTKTQFSGKNLPFVGFGFTDTVDEPTNYDVTRVKNEQIEEMRKEIAALRKTNAKRHDDGKQLSVIERKLEEKSRQLESAENVRDNLERHLAATITECNKLKRTMELERKDRADLECKALDLIKGAKQKWEIAEKKKIDTLTNEINGYKETIERLTRSNCLLEEQLKNANHGNKKVSLEKLEQLNRRSVIGLESRIEKITVDYEKQMNDLQIKLGEEMKQKLIVDERLTNYIESEKQMMKQLEENKNTTKQLTDELETTKRSLVETNKTMKLIENQSENDSKTIEELNEKITEIERLKNELKNQKLESKKLLEQIDNLKQETVTKEKLHQRHLTDLEKSNREQLEQLKKQLNKTVEERNKLEIDLQESHKNEIDNKLKVVTLEELVKRLESGVTKLETEYEKENVLKEQIERLEKQLITAHETFAVEKQELEQLKTKMWRVERDLNNAEIDKRICKRETKEAEAETKKVEAELEAVRAQLQASRKIHEGALLELSDLNDNLGDEIEKYKTRVVDLENSLKKERSKNEQNDSIVMDLQRAMQEKNSVIANKTKEIEVIRCEKMELKRKLDSINAEQESVSRKLNTIQREKRELEEQLAISKRDAQNTQLNLQALREACTLVENQLEEYEKLQKSYEEKERSLTDDKEKLLNELTAAKQELQESRKSTNEERSLKHLAETKEKRLGEDVEALKRECAAYKQQCTEFRDCSTNLAEELALAEEKISDLEVNVKVYERQISALSAECNALKEENSEQRTHLCNVKETNYQLNHQLLETKRTNGSLLQEISELQTVLSEKTNYHKDREMKSQATIQQQTKLIDYLQSQMEEAKKKKSITDLIFGHSKKENQPPTPVAMNYKELETLFAKEKTVNRSLRTEIERLRNEKSSRDGKNSDKSLSPRTKIALEQLAQSPSKSETNFNRHESRSQRMRHKIPHRFESKLCTKSTKCIQCSNNIAIGRSMSVCKECNLHAHTHCTRCVAKTCGLPKEYVELYSELNQIVADNDKKKSQENINVEGWVKIPIKGNWEKHYACLTDRYINVYREPPNNPSVTPIEFLELHPSDSHGKVVLEPVDSELDVPIARNDLPFVIKVEISPNTTCWPPKSLIMMTLSVEDKEKWFRALREIFSDEREKLGTVLLKHQADIEVNCATMITNDCLLLGTEQGLFTYRNRTLVHIAGPIQIQQMAVNPTNNLAVMIVDADRFLITCDLNHLKNLTESAQISKPTLIFRNVRVNLTGFLSFSANDKVLSAVTEKQLVIFTYCLKNRDYNVARILDTAQPVSCFLYTKHTLIVGADKFFEIDLNDFSAEEFLDPSDKNLINKFQLFPLAIFKIRANPAEFLLCYNEIGVFVDEFGRTSREDEIKWHRHPRHFHYHDPYLFVIQFNSIEIVEIRDSIEPFVRFDCENVKFLGAARRGILVDWKNEVKSIEFDADNDSDDGSENNANENDSEQFSFTSSLVHSLETDESDERSRKVTFSSDV